jgi:hypothetical protein
MKKSLGILLALALMTGAGFAQAGRGGGGHGGGARAGGAHYSGSVAGRPSGGFTRFTTGPMQFTTGPHWRPPIVGHPPGGVRPIPLPPRPVAPIRNPPTFVGGGTVIVTAPLWYPYNPDAPAYADQGYTERDDYWYYCPDSQTYYPYVSTCASPWVKVLPEPTDGAAPAN